MNKTLFVTFLGVFLVLLQMQAATVTSTRVGSVDIYNLMLGEEIQVNCKALGQKTLTYGERYGFRFRPSMWGDTTYTCGFRWGAKSQRFVVWMDPDAVDTRREPFRPCVHCVWYVGRDGFYVSESGEQFSSVVVFKWLTPAEMLSKMTIHE